MPQVFQQPAR